MDSANTGITLEYADRKVLFPIGSAGIWHNAKGALCFEIEADGSNLEMRSVDWAYGPPMINAGWDDGKYTPIEELSGSVIRIPESYDERLQDHVTTFYLSEHFDLNDLNLKFGQYSEGKIRMEFSGFVPEDPTGSTPDKGIKVTGQAILSWRGD